MVQLVGVVAQALMPQPGDGAQQLVQQQQQLAVGEKILAQPRLVDGLPTPVRLQALAVGVILRVIVLLVDGGARVSSPVAGMSNFYYNGIL